MWNELIPERYESIPEQNELIPDKNYGIGMDSFCSGIDSHRSGMNSFRYSFFHSEHRLMFSVGFDNTAIVLLMTDKVSTMKLSSL